MLGMLLIRFPCAQRGLGRMLLTSLS
jgi:hypothetical protein